MDESNKLILVSQNNLIPKVTITLSITNKLLAESNRALVLEIFMKNPNLFVGLISRYYPLSEVLINQSKNKLNKNVLINNQNLPWSIEFFKKYHFAWHITDEQPPPIPWLTLFNNNYFIFNADFDNLSSFKSIPWTIELIERFKEDWTWVVDDEMEYWAGNNCLLNNKSLP